MTRDPRVNPMPGDILRRGGVFCGTFYEVLSHDPRLYSNDVSYFDDRERAMSIGPWCEFMRGAEVIRAVGDPDRRAELAAMRERAEKAERERDALYNAIVPGPGTFAHNGYYVEAVRKLHAWHLEAQNRAKAMTTERDKYRDAWRCAVTTAEKLSEELAAEARVKLIKVRRFGHGDDCPCAVCEWARSEEQKGTMDMNAEVDDLAALSKPEIIAIVEEQRRKLAAQEEQLAEARRGTERLDWMEANPRRIVHAAGYCGSADLWCWRDTTPELSMHEADSLRESIDAAKDGKP